MAEESVAREDIPSNRMLMDEINVASWVGVPGYFFLGLCFND